MQLVCWLRKDVRGADFFLQGHQGGCVFDKQLGCGQSEAQHAKARLLPVHLTYIPRLLGRELQPPWEPKAWRLQSSLPLACLAAAPQGETYCDPEELDVTLSRELIWPLSSHPRIPFSGDQDELGQK